MGPQRTLEAPLALSAAANTPTPQDLATTVGLGDVVGQMGAAHKCGAVVNSHARRVNIRIKSCQQLCITFGDHKPRTLRRA